MLTSVCSVLCALLSLLLSILIIIDASNIITSHQRSINCDVVVGISSCKVDDILYDCFLSTILTHMRP